MARDYKRKRKTKPKKRSTRSSSSSPWMFLASGFGLGLVAALALYLQLRPQEIEAPDRPIPNASVAPKSSTESEPVVSEPPVVAAKPVTKPVATPTPKAESDYDFYDVLPGYEVVVADEDNQPVVKPDGQRPARPAETSDKPAHYILQAGSFRKFVDADRQKARLAFKGIESNIQPVVLKEGETWHRVYVGPTTDFASLENMRSDLRRANIDVLILKVRP